MARASYRLLGPVEVRLEDRLVDVGHARQRSVLVALLVEANRVVPLGRLVECLWGDDPPATSTDLVYGYVSRLRRQLGRSVRLVHVPGGYSLEADPDSVDLHRFRRLVAAARSAQAGGSATDLFAEALGLWRGTALTGATGQWIDDLRLTLEAERVAVMLDHCEARLRLDADAGLLGDIRGLLAGQPFDERAADLFMRAAYRSGRRAEALDCYHQLRIRLATEVGVEPGPRLAELFRDLLRDDPALDGQGGSSQPPEQPQAPAVPEVRFALPPDTVAFTGRDVELSQITSAVAGAAGPGGVVAVRAIDGMPGVGKTALAVHAAHLLRNTFPDRQLFVDLRAHVAGRDPVAPEDALAGLLAVVGVDPRFMPADLEGRAAMWRDRMAGQRALLVLDNAASSDQVAPLLPGGSCLALVTSRRHLGDLPGVVTPVLLDVLPPGQAAEMFTRLAPCAAASPAEVAEVVRLAGFLPLAICLLARVFARHPSWTLADLVAETKAGVLTLTAENASIAAAFEVSYRYLDPARQRFFGLLGIHLGATIDGYAAAALAGTSLERAAELLDGLQAEGLVTETGHRRYGMHDLLRRYARGHSADGEQARERLLDYYQRTATRAEACLAYQTHPRPADRAVPPGEAPSFEDVGQALAWARAERANLLGGLDYAASTGQHARVVALTAALTQLLRRDGPWTDAISRHTAAIQAAQRLGDRLGEANLANNLADMRRLTGEYPAAVQALERALAIYGDLGNQLGEANALTNLGTVRWLTGEYPAAVQALERALGIYRDLGDRRGEGNALTSLGTVRRLTGDYADAAQALDQALGIYRDLGDRHGEANALTYLGDVRRLTSEYPAAAQSLEEALRIYRDRGNRHGEANALSFLGVVRRLTGEYLAAAQALEQALSICRGLGNRGGEVEVLNETGTLHRVSGDLARAQRCHQQALELARATASFPDEAHALAGLGRCSLAAGRVTSARDLLRQSEEIFLRIGAAEARTISAELRTLTGSQGPRSAS